MRAILLMLAACKQPQPVDTENPHDSEIVEAPFDYPQFAGEIPHNLLFVSIDTLRKNEIGVFGGPAPMPFLEGLATESVVLTDSVACSDWTFPSMACSIAGRDNIDMGFVMHLAAGAGRTVLPEGTSTLPQWLHDAGYTSVLVTSNRWISHEYNFTQGYQTAIHAPTVTRSVIDQGVELVLPVAAAGDPWFLHLHVKEPHSPYDPPPEYLAGLDGLPPLPWDLGTQSGYDAGRLSWASLSEEDRENLENQLHIRYHGEIRWLDDQLGEAWRRLDAAGLLDDTLVVVYTDHGEQFWDHGRSDHANELFREENDSFVMLWSRGIVPDTWDGPTSHIDIAPTVLTILQQPIPPEVTGLPVGTAPADRPRFTLACGRIGAIQAVIVDNMKLHYNWRGTKTFFKWDTDPTEANNLYSPDDPDVIRLWGLLQPRVDAAMPLIPDQPPVDPGP